MIPRSERAGWFVLWFSLKIAKGEPVWGFPTNKTDVIYLALEDRRWRIQDRIQALTDTPPNNLRIGFSCGIIGEELEAQLKALLKEKPGTGIIFIDTFQKVRDNISGKTNAYAKDYQDLSALKKIADDHGIRIFLVHHNRKERDSSNVFHDITGSTGIAGVADTIMVLRKEDHFSSDAVLSITGRDIEERKLKLRMNKNVWEATEELQAEKKETIPNVILNIARYFLRNDSFEGTMSALLSAIGDHNTKPNVASRYLTRYFNDILKPLGIVYENHHRAEERIIKLFRDDGNDDKDDNDDYPGSGGISSYEAKYMELMAGYNGQLTLPRVSPSPPQTEPAIPEYDAFYIDIETCARLLRLSGRTAFSPKENEDALLLSSRGKRISKRTIEHVVLDLTRTYLPTVKDGSGCSFSDLRYAGVLLSA